MDTHGRSLVDFASPFLALPRGRTCRQCVSGDRFADFADLADLALADLVLARARAAPVPARARARNAPVSASARRLARPGASFHP